MSSLYVQTYWGVVNFVHFVNTSFPLARRRCAVACWLDQQCTTKPSPSTLCCGLLVGSAVYDKPSLSTLCCSLLVGSAVYDKPSLSTLCCMWPAGWISSVRQTQPVDVCCGLLVGSAVYDNPACWRCAVACWLDQQCTTNPACRRVLLPAGWISSVRPTSLSTLCCSLLVGSAVYDQPACRRCAVACWLDQQCTTNQPVDAVLWPAGWISSVRQTQPVDAVL